MSAAGAAPLADVHLPTVIVPVYNAADEVEACLRSLRSTLPETAQVLVIDDASPDPAVASLLDAWRTEAGRAWRFERNPRNLGFVGTANRGFRMTPGDVVLLNSDTLVTPGWLQALARCLGSGRDVATATPWTNNGEIASIPVFCAANSPPADAAAVARAIAGAGRPRYPALPTAVGFCMAVSRRALEEVGGFDAGRFGRGYGEENDFSLRAEAAGMRNLLCDDAYVVHLGGRSFGPLGLRPGPDSMQRLLASHPAYLERVQAFIASDPLAARRGEILDAIDRAGVMLG